MVKKRNVVLLSLGDELCSGRRQVLRALAHGVQHGGESSLSILVTALFTYAMPPP